MAMTPKILFAYQLAAVSGPTEVTAGPAASKKWIITNLLISASIATAGTLLVTQDIGGTAYVIHGLAAFAAGATESIGPIIMENGNTLDATSTGASVVYNFVAYGYELDV